MIDVNKAIATAVKTGKVVFGARKAVESVKLARARLVVISSNCERNTMEDLVHYGKLSGVPLVIYKGSSIDLGAVCGKPFAVSALTVREPGDSEILRLGEESKEEPREAEETLEEPDA